MRAWIAHAEHAHTWRLRHAIFFGGPFDPACANDLPRWPLGPQAGAWPAPSRNRVNRGGSWNHLPRNLRSANRNRNEPDNRNNNLGFRLARTPLTSQSRRVHGRDRVSTKGVDGRPWRALAGAAVLISMG